MKLNIPNLLYRLNEKLLYKLNAYGRRQYEYFYVLRKYVHNGIVLDVGSSQGFFTRLLAKSTHSVVIAIDIDYHVLKNMKVKDWNIDRICADAHNLPIRGGSVSYVLSISLIEHLQKPEKHIMEVHRVLKDGGIFIVQLPNLQYLFEPHTKFPLLFLFPERIQNKIFEALNYPYVNMKVSIKYFLTLINNMNFSLRETIKIYHLEIMKLFPIAPSYIFIIEKHTKHLKL